MFSRRPKPGTGSKPLPLVLPKMRGAANLETALIEIAIPAYNEQDVLESSIRRLRTYLDQVLSLYGVDRHRRQRQHRGTWEIATRLCSELHDVKAIHLDQKGRGRAIRTAWTASQSEVVVYMDVDLSTDLDGLLPRRPRCCPATAKWPSGRGSRQDHGFYVAASGSSSRGPTTSS